MNIYGPYRLNKDSGKYEPEMYPTIADLVLTKDGKTVAFELASINEQFAKVKEELKALQNAVLGITPDALIIQSNTPEGDSKRLWINPENSLMHYWNGEEWMPVTGVWG